MLLNEDRNYTTYEYNRDHFISRLSERFDIKMTTCEYDILMQNGHRLVEHLYWLNYQTSLCRLCINGVNMAVVKKRKSKSKEAVLITCFANTLFTDDIKMPVPLEIVKAKIPPVYFWEHFNIVYANMLRMVKAYEAMPIEAKEYFATFPYGGTIQEHKLAYVYIVGKKFKLRYLFAHVIKDILIP